MAKKYDWTKSYADYPDVGRIYDSDVGLFAKKHLRIIDRFDMRKVASAILWSQLILFDVVKEADLPKKKNWKFFKDF